MNDECVVLVMVMLAGDQTKIFGISLINLVNFSSFICEQSTISLVCHWDGPVAKFFYFAFSVRLGCREHFVSGCWHSSWRDCGRYPRECWLSTLGVLHPDVPVMWYAHIRDLSPTAEAVREAVCPM